MYATLFDVRGCLGLPGWMLLGVGPIGASESIVDGNAAQKLLARALTGDGAVGSIAQ